MKLNIIMICSALLLWNCTQEKSQTVSGKIENAGGKKLSLVGYKGGQPDTVGTKMLDAQGNFEIPVNANRLAFYTLAIGTDGGVVLAFDSTQSPVVTANAETLAKTYDVSGSKDSEAIRDVFVKSVVYEQTLDSAMKAMRAAATQGENASRMDLSILYNDTRKEYREYLLQHIDNDSSNIANFSILQRLDPKQDFAYFTRVRNGLSPRMSGNTFFDKLANKIAAMEAEQKVAAAMDEGVVAPDIALPNPEGDVVALSSLRGKYVLIDFWASWCKPCRMENPNVVKLYDKYKNDNFEIYGVSLDKDADKWTQAIAQDNLEWIHVSDLQFWNSAAARLYNVSSIPFTMLIDPEGKIVDTKLRGKALENKLAGIFGH